jgi:hypothetical protein
MEEEVGHEFAHLMSYKNGWGHIVADGSLVHVLLLLPFEKLLEKIHRQRCSRSIALQSCKLIV